MARRFIVCAGILWACWAFPAEVRAQRPASGSVALAKKHYLAGETFYRQGEFAKAVIEYRRALKIKRYPALLFNIAQCHRHLGQHKQAIFFYKLFLVASPQAPTKAQVLQLIGKLEVKLAKAERLRQQADLNRGVLTIISEPPGAKVLLDRVAGKSESVTPAVLRLEAGQHLVVVSKPGFQTEHRRVTVKPRGVALIKITLKSLTRARPVAARPPAVKALRRTAAARRTPPRYDLVTRWKMKTFRRPPCWKRWWFWTGIIVGGGLLGGGAYMGLEALEAEDRYKKTWNERDKSDGMRNAAIADIMYLTGGLIYLGVIIGAAVVGKGSTYEKPVRVMALAPSCGPTGCGLLLRGTFR